MNIYTSLIRPLLKDKHFLIAAILLATTAAGWEAARGFLKVVTKKEPVPWPEGVQVAQNDHKLMTLGDKTGRIGPYALVQDHEFTENETDTRNKLGIATEWDKSSQRWETGRSNWYSIRWYEDPITKRAWQVSVYYYTGGLDLVPHIPDICLVAGGNTLLGTSRVALKPVDGVEGWDQPYATRTSFQTGRSEHAIYYLFSINGLPQHSREMVRLKLQNPFERYVYFAKIEFRSLAPVTTFEESDNAAREFASILLPEVLKVLPSAQDVRRLSDK